jgi:hypothetical protein
MRTKKTYRFCQNIQVLPKRIGYRNYNKYSDLKFRMGFFNDDRLAGQIKSSDGSELRFGTAIDLANSNFGWSSLDKPARLPAAVNSLSRSAECGPALNSFSPAACVRSWRSLARSASLAPPASLATCLQLIFFFQNVFLGTRRASPARSSGNPASDLPQHFF